MAHHLAGRMLDLEQKTGSHRLKAEAEIADLILGLWNHRRHFPEKKYPLVEIDDIEAALARLAPGRRTWSYFQVFEVNVEPNPEELDTNAALNAALYIDRIAGNLVNSLIGYATTVATTKNAAWVKHAEKIGDTSFKKIKDAYHSISDDGYTDDNDGRIHEVQKHITDLLSIVLKLETLFADRSENYSEDL